MTSYFKIIGKLTTAILSLEHVLKTPLCLASSAGGEVMIFNYEDGSIQRIVSHPKDIYPIERVNLVNKAAVSLGSPSCILFYSSFDMVIYSFSLNKDDKLGELRLDSRLETPLFCTNANDHSRILVFVDADHYLYVVQLPFLKVLSTSLLKIDPPESRILQATWDEETQTIILALSSGGIFLVAPK